MFFHDYNNRKAGIYKMPDISVLIIDDEPSILKAVSMTLKQEHIAVTCADNGTLALDILKANTFDLILLDIIMPDQDGFSILKVIRSSQNYTPVILLSGRGEDSAQVKGLELGADDYITKPFSKTVLVSKIRAMVRRTNQYVSSSDEVITEVKKGPFALRMDSQTVLKNGKEISLTSKEFSLLYLFIENPEYIFSKQELFSKVWRSDNCDDSTILIYIKKLRVSWKRILLIQLISVLSGEKVTSSAFSSSPPFPLQKDPPVGRLSYDRWHNLRLLFFLQ